MAEQNWLQLTGKWINMSHVTHLIENGDGWEIHLAGLREGDKLTVESKDAATLLAFLAPREVSTRKSLP